MHGSKGTSTSLSGLCTMRMSHEQMTMWHNKINRLAGKSHPNIYENVELFKTEQAATEVSLLPTSTQYISALCNWVRFKLVVHLQYS